MAKTHKHRRLRGRSVNGHPGIVQDGPRPEPHEPGHSRAIGGHGPEYAVRSSFHTVSMHEARRRDHSPAIAGTA